MHVFVSWGGSFNSVAAFDIRRLSKKGLMDISNILHKFIILSGKELKRPPPNKFIIIIKRAY